MKNILTKRIFAVIICLAMLMGALALPIAALDAVNWSYSEDQDMITDGANKYFKYKKAGYLEINPKEKYVFSNGIQRHDDTLDNTIVDYSINSHARETDVIWLEEKMYVDSHSFVYATKEGAQRLDKLITFEDCVYYLEDDSYRDVKLPEDIATQLTSFYRSTAHKKTTFEVANLKDAQHFIVYAYEHNLAFRRELGSIFYINGNMYFVEYDLLSNDHFTADGEFSFRSGEVKLAKLPTNLFSQLKNSYIDKLERYSVNYTFEEDELYEPSHDDDYDEASAKLAFGIFYSLICFITPLPLFILGLILPHPRKLGKKKYWYSLTAISGLYILIGIILLLVILL